MSELNGLSFFDLDREGVGFLCQYDSNSKPAYTTLYNMLWGGLNVGSTGIMRRNIFRGRNFGTAVTDEQWEEIRKGTFKDMFLGDHWVIGNVAWQIVDFDYWWRTFKEDPNDNTRLTTVNEHHLVIMPMDTLSFDLSMNDSLTNSGGYIGSKMNKEYLRNKVDPLVIAAFGSDHLLTVQRRFSNAITNGEVTGLGYFNSTIDLPSITMLTGGMWPTRNSESLGSGEPQQLAYFQQSPAALHSSYTYWTCDTGAANQFYAASSFRNALGSYNANGVYRVRPVFAIKG